MERMMCDAKITRICEGINQIQRIVMARQRLAQPQWGWISMARDDLGYLAKLVRPVRQSGWPELKASRSRFSSVSPLPPAEPLRTC